jgi:hypothetical protein
VVQDADDLHLAAGDAVGQTNALSGSGSQPTSPGSAR